MELSVGVLKDITQGKEPQAPIVQILGIKAMEKKIDQTDRYRVLLSDSKYQHSSCMLVTQLNHMVENQDIVSSSIIRMDKYICNCIDKMANRYVIIILEATVIRKRCPKLGSPVHLVTALQSNGAADSPTKSDSEQAQKRPIANAANSIASKLPRSNVLLHSGNNELPSFTIDRLNPYQNKWTIKVRVTNKCPVRRWSNSRGEGRLFSFDVIDNTGEMRVTAFNEECDKFFDLIEANKVYMISRGKIKPANRQFSSLQNDYEMTLGFDSSVEPCDEIDENLPKTSFNFIQLKEVLNKENNDIIDVVAVAHASSELQTIVTRSTKKEVHKKNVSLIDETAAISCTFWGSQAEQFDATEPKVIALKGVRVSDFNGRSLSVLNSTLVAENPDIPEKTVLMSWFERKGGQIGELPDLSAGGSGGVGQSVDGDRNYSSMKHLCDLTVDPAFDSGQAEYSSVKAVVVGSRKENALYRSCPTPDCNKKVYDQGDGTFRCEKCDRATTEFKWRYILQVNVADFTDNHWVTFFNDASEQIVGMSAEKLGELMETAASQYDDTLLAINFTEHLFRVRSKLETYNDERRMKITCVNVSPLNYSEYGNQLLSELKK